MDATTVGTRRIGQTAATIRPESGTTAFGEALLVAESSRRSVCRGFLKDLERKVDDLIGRVALSQSAERRGDEREAFEQWGKAFDVLGQISWLLDKLEECAHRVGPDGQPLLNEAEKALIRNLAGRARKAAEAGDLPIPDELYFKASQGDPEALRKIEEFVKAAGGGIKRGAEITGQLLLGLLGLLAAFSRKPAF